VDAYLARIEHTEATRLDLDPFKVTYVDHAGTVDPGRPARELFWAAGESSASKPLSWKLRSGKWSILVMNADGSRNVAGTIGVGVKVPAARWGRDRAEPVRSRAARRCRVDVHGRLAGRPSRGSESSLG
jgi:hypothetical protein